MNTKKIALFSAVITILFLSGCVAPPYYGGTASYNSGGYYGGVGARASYRYQPLFYGSRVFFGGHRHFRGGHRHFRSGHRVGSHRSVYRHRGGGHRHFRGGHRGGHRGHGGHRGRGSHHH